MKRIVSLTCALALTLALTACSSGGNFTGSAESSSRDFNIQPGAAESNDDSSSVQPEDDSKGGSSSAEVSQPETASSAILYIGMDGRFAEYSLELEEVTPEALVAGISELTGWNLDLADEITSGKGGMTVTFAETSALFVGPPDPQKDEFHVYDAMQLYQTILDSVQKTLQEWAVVPGLGDPSGVDIYFCGPGGSDLVLEGLDLTISSLEPYRGFPSGT